MFLVSSCSCLCPIHWSQVLSWEWRCSWSSADRRCFNCIWVINNFIAYWGASSYIRDSMVCQQQGPKCGREKASIPDSKVLGAHLGLKGPMLAPWTLLSGMLRVLFVQTLIWGQITCNLMSRIYCKNAGNLKTFDTYHSESFYHLNTGSGLTKYKHVEFLPHLNYIILSFITRLTALSLLNVCEFTQY